MFRACGHDNLFLVVVTGPERGSGSSSWLWDQPLVLGPVRGSGSRPCFWVQVGSVPLAVTSLELLAAVRGADHGSAELSDSGLLLTDRPEPYLCVCVCLCM